MSPNRSARLAVSLSLPCCVAEALPFSCCASPSSLSPVIQCFGALGVLLLKNSFGTRKKKRICTSLFWAWLYLEDSLESKHVSQDYFISRQMKSVGFFHMARQKQLLNRNIRQSWGTVDCLHMVIEQLKTYFQRSRVFRLSASFVSFIMYYSLKEPTHAHFEYLKQISECLRLSTHMCRYWIWGVCV